MNILIKLINNIHVMKYHIEIIYLQNNVVSGYALTITSIFEMLLAKSNIELLIFPYTNDYENIIKKLNIKY